MPDAKVSWEQSLETLRAKAASADGNRNWPADSWDALRASGALRWCIPEAYGGAGLEGGPLLEKYEQLAGACLTTSFILSQRDAACRRIRDSGNEVLCQRLLPPLARGETFATVGLSQLTTSRQHGQPAFRAELTPDGIVLDGTIPWVTGAKEADHIIIGAVLSDSWQILAVLPRGVAGVTMGEPLDLMALEGSMTTEVRCQQARLDRHWLLAGPAERIMAAGKSGTGGLETSCLALGLAGAALQHLHGEATSRPELASSVARLARTRDSLRRDLYHLAEAGCTGEDASALRARMNAFVLRVTQSALAASKGTGFLRRHPAQRWARQAMFFLVWSCPRPATDATLAYLADAGSFACAQWD